MYQQLREDASRCGGKSGAGRATLVHYPEGCPFTEDPVMARSAAFLRLRNNVLAVIHDVPAGRVTTYGTIAEYLGITPRDVARVLSGLSEAESEVVPWHRVVAAGGVISTLRAGEVGRRQIARLFREGVH